MPYKEKPITKRYWTIGEIAEELGESTSCIRFWESEFCIKVKRNDNVLKTRRYSKAEREKILKIHQLIRVDKYTFEGARLKL